MQKSLAVVGGSNFLTALGVLRRGMSWKFIEVRDCLAVRG